MDEKCVGCLMAARNFRQFASVLALHDHQLFTQTYIFPKKSAICLINTFANLHMSAICKLGKGFD
jgi:hypothetical protein